MRRTLARIVRVRKSGWPLQGDDQIHIQYRFARIRKTSRETGTWIIGKPNQQTIHSLDFHGLVVGDIGGKFEQNRVVGRTWLFKELFHHFHSTIVMTDHQLKEQTVKSCTLGCCKLRHLLRRGHASHGV